MADSSRAVAVASSVRGQRWAPRFSCVFLGCSAEDYRSASGLLREAGIQLYRAASVEQAETLLRVGESLVLLTEAAFPGGVWRDALAMKRERHPEAVLVVTTALPDERLWLDAIEQGAYDLILKPFVADELLRILEHANACARLRTSAGRALTAGLGW